MDGIGHGFSVAALLRESVQTSTTGEYSGSRHRRPRTVFSKMALDRMEAEFEQNQYPDIRRREAIAAEIGVSEARIQVWFQNRRARCNKRRNLQETSHDVNAAADDRPKPSKRQRLKKGLAKEKLTPADEGTKLPVAPQLSSQMSHLPGYQFSPLYFYHGFHSFPNTAMTVPITWFPSHYVYASGDAFQAVQGKSSNDDTDDIVKRLFRFSSATHAHSMKQDQQHNEPSKPLYRMVVPHMRVSDCSVTELHTSEERASDHTGPAPNSLHQEGPMHPDLVCLENDDSGLALDSFTD